MAYRDEVYVIAGGDDDGITVLQMLPDGQLVTRATIADSTTMTLDNVSAIAGTGSGDGLDIFVASSSEGGITRLRYDIGPAGLVLTAQAAGETLTGGAGGDLLTGRDGDDRLFGRGGDDIVRGGAGADLFVLSRDGTGDTIKDFSPGIDRIDLSGWDFLRDRAQLIFAITSTGFTITYGDEFLIVQSADGNPIDHRQIPTMDLMGGARIPIVIRPGYPDPVMPVTDIPGESTPTEVTTDAGAAPRSPTAGITTIACLRFTLPRMAATNGLTRGAGDGNNRLEGLGSHDMMAGGGGDDILVRRGNDRVYGGSGSNRIYGDAGSDLLRGGNASDWIYGGLHGDVLFGGGRDLLTGFHGNDRLCGGSGADVMYGQRDSDILNGGGGADRIFGGSENDTLNGARDSDLLNGGADDDLLFGET